MHIGGHIWGVCGLSLPKSLSKHEWCLTLKTESNGQQQLANNQVSIMWSLLVLNVKTTLNNCFFSAVVPNSPPPVGCLFKDNPRTQQKQPIPASVQGLFQLLFAFAQQQKVAMWCKHAVWFKTEFSFPFSLSLSPTFQWLCNWLDSRWSTWQTAAPPLVLVLLFQTW